jgi:hypothetical protein
MDYIQIDMVTQTTSFDCFKTLNFVNLKFFVVKNKW